LKLTDYICGNCVNAIPIDKFREEFTRSYKEGMACIEIHNAPGANRKYICGLDYFPFAEEFTNLVLWTKGPNDFCSRHELKCDERSEPSDKNTEASATQC